jgi:hypothetical protein
MSDFYYFGGPKPRYDARMMLLRSRTLPAREHLYYSGLALLYALTVFVGFSRAFYLKGLFGTPRLSWLFHLHGAVFTAWTLFFVFQTALVAAGRTDLHRRIGWTGAIFASGIVVFGALVTFQAVRAGLAVGRPRMPLLLIDGMIDLLLFCLFFGLALLLRRRKEIHKRLMVLAMLCLIIPAIGRLPIPPNMIGWAIFAVSLAGLIYDAFSTGRIYVTNVLGVLLINISSPLRFMIADTRTWQSFAEWLGR